MMIAFLDLADPNLARRDTTLRYSCPKMVFGRKFKQRANFSREYVYHVSTIKRTSLAHLASKTFGLRSCCFTRLKIHFATAISLSENDILILIHPVRILFGRIMVN